MTGTLIHLFVATLAFVGGHFVLSSPRIRSRLVGAIGERVFAALYSAIMLASFVWVVAAYRVAPPRIIWDFGPSINFLPLIVMPFALMLAVAGLLSRNPTAVMGEKMLEQSYSPTGPVTITRHPFLCSVAMWGIAHLLANGDAASIILFGGMTVLAVGGMYAIDHKRALRLGRAWEEFAAHTSRLPFAAAFARRARVDWRGIGWVRPGLGLIVYGVLAVSHDRLFGVPAMVIY